MTPKSPRLLDLRKAAAETGLAYGAIYALITKGVLPVVKFPDHRRLYVRREDIEG